jgi:selenocysteine lyase/cysteine desulfurase
VVHGLVQSDSTAEIITDLALRHTRFDFFHKLLSQILAERGGIKLTSHTRQGAAKPLLAEIQEIQKCRDQIVHRGETATRQQADEAIAAARTILEEMAKLGYWCEVSASSSGHPGIC